MLVNCPKCGFSQPKDHYCAKCGVDMDSFAPKGPSFLSQIFGHPAIQIGFILGLVFLAVVFIKAREPKTFLEQVEQMPRGMVTLDKKVELPVEAASTEPDLPLPPVPNVSGEPTPVAVAGTPTATPLPAAFGATPAATPAAADSTKLKAAATSASKAHLKVIYAEVDLITLQKWVPEMQASGQYSDQDFKMGILPQLQKKIDADRSIVILDTVQKNWTTLPGAQEWMLSVPQTSAGLKTRVQLSETDPGMIKGDIRMIRNLEPEDPKSFESEFEAPSHAGWVFWGMLSPKVKNGLEQMPNLMSFFQIYKSARFKSLRTDFTIFYLFDTPSSQ